MEDDRIFPIQSSILEVPPPTPHIILMICLIFCIVGGILMVCSAGLGWVVEAAEDGATNPDHVLYLTDIVEYGGQYLWLLIPVIGGLAVLLFSIICYLKEKQQKGIWSLTCAIVSIITTTAMVVSIIYLNNDLAKFGENSMLGPAAYILVFGGVLQVAGAVILLINTFLSSTDVKGAVRPFAVPPHVEPANHKPGGNERSFPEKLCPGCQSPVKASWQICPVCGRLLR